jgi:hypothetical protein
MRRRRYLALLGTGVGTGLAGCSGGGGSSTPTDAGTDTPIAEPTATATATAEPDYAASFRQAIESAGLEIREFQPDGATVTLEYAAGTRDSAAVDEQITAVADAYAQVVGQGWSNDGLSVRFYDDDTQIGAFQVQQSWAASAASGDTDSEEYHGRVEETLETLGVGTPGPEPEPREFDGYGRSGTGSFDLEPGLVGVEYTYQGESNFTLRMEAADGGGGGRLVTNRVGRVKDASTAFRTPGGSFSFSVDSVAKWDIRVEQPRPGLSDATRLPTVVTNSKPKYVGPFAFGFEEATLEAQHGGDGTFQVRLLDDTGRRVETLFDEKGAFEGSTTTEFTGIGWLDVSAGAKWTINLK